MTNVKHVHWDSFPSSIVVTKCVLDYIADIATTTSADMDVPGALVDAVLGAVESVCLQSQAGVTFA